MPDGSGSGIVHSTTFTPTISGKCVVTCRYEAQGTSGGDWGSAYNAKCFVTQSSVTTYGNAMPLTTTRAAYAARYVFDVVSGASVEFGLYSTISGAVSASFWNIDITAHVIKG